MPSQWAACDLAHPLRSRLYCCQLRRKRRRPRQRIGQVGVQPAIVVLFMQDEGAHFGVNCTDEMVRRISIIYGIETYPFGSGSPRTCSIRRYSIASVTTPGTAKFSCSQILICCSPSAGSRNAKANSAGDIPRFNRHRRASSPSIRTDSIKTAVIGLRCAECGISCAPGIKVILEAMHKIKACV